MNFDTQIDYLIPYNGGYNSFNNIAFSNDGNFGYFYDNTSTNIIRLNLSNGEKEIMKFFDKEYYNKKWLSISLFVITLETVPHLVILFYNCTKKFYQFVMFSISNNNTLLIKLREIKIILDEELKHFNYHDIHYSVGHGNDDTLIEVIFYKKSELEFVFFQLDCKLFTLKKRIGELFGKRKRKKFNMSEDDLRIWEYPFLKNDHVIFISNNKDKCMAKFKKSITSEKTFMTVEIDELLPDKRNCIYPEYSNTTWCVSWYNNYHIFVIFIKNRENQEYIVQIWSIEDGIRNDPVHWKKYNLTLKIDKNAKNFGIRITKNKTLFIHYDIEKYRDKLHKINLKAIEMNCEEIENYINDIPREVNIDDEIMKRQNKKNSLFVEKELSCPICLELYNDPRNLNCGHSLCFNCCNLLEIKNESSNENKKNIICPICRENTEIPTSGLSKNYCLEEAIIFILKTKNDKTEEIRCHSCQLFHQITNSFICLSCNNETLQDNLINCEQYKQLCSSCILITHKNHSYVPLEEYTKRQTFINDKKKEIDNMIEELTKNFKESIFNTITNCLLSIEQKRFYQIVEKKLNHNYIENEKKFNDNQNYNFKKNEEKINDIIENFKSDIKYLENEIIKNLEEVCDEVIDKRERTITIEMYNKLSKVDSV